MTAFIWHSNTHKESATWLAEMLQLKAGTAVEWEHKGPVICWGAYPKGGFTLQDDVVSINNPEKVRKYTNRHEMFSVLKDLGLKTTLLVPLNNEAGQVKSAFLLREELGLHPHEKLIISSQALTDKIVVAGDQLPTELITKKHKLALASTDSSTLRVFIFHGAVMGCAKIKTLDNEIYAARAAVKLKEEFKDLITEAQIRNIIYTGLKKELFSQKPIFWSVLSDLHKDNIETALKASAALNYDLCAVDMTDEGTITNIVTTPNLREAPSVAKTICAYLSSWVEENNNKDTKSILTEIINGASETELHQFLGAIRPEKKGGKKALSKKTKRVAGRTSGAPTKHK